MGWECDWWPPPSCPRARAWSPLVTGHRSASDGEGGRRESRGDQSTRDNQTATTRVRRLRQEQWQHAEAQACSLYRAHDSFTNSHSSHKHMVRKKTLCLKCFSKLYASVEIIQMFFKAIEIKSITKLSPSSTLPRTPSKSSYLCVGFPDRKPTAKLKETLNILIPIDRELRVGKSMEIWAGIIAGISDQTLRQETQPAGAAITPGLTLSLLPVNTRRPIHWVDNPL